jgi:hypothetical protein
MGSDVNSRLKLGYLLWNSYAILIFNFLFSLFHKKSIAFSQKMEFYYPTQIQLISIQLVSYYFYFLMTPFETELRSNGIIKLSSETVKFYTRLNCFFGVTDLSECEGIYFKTRSFHTYLYVVVSIACMICDIIESLSVYT